jgi:hypothetical protein
MLCVDEKSQIQALDRTAPTLPLQPGLAERRSHDYVRHGTSTLFAALEIATGQVTAACKPRHRHQEFLPPDARTFDFKVLGGLADALTGPVGKEEQILSALAGKPCSLVPSSSQN